MQTPNEADQALSLARQALLRYASFALSDPLSGSWRPLSDPASQDLASQAAALVRDEPRARAEPLAPAERTLAELDPALLFARLPDTRGELIARHQAVFGLLASGPCPPHETDYLAEKATFQRSHALADVSGFYRAFGLRPSRSHPERHDHIALELEFSAFLLGLERDADTEERAAVVRDARKRFLEEHLAWWAPAFGKLLDHEAPESYYAAAGRFLAALVAAERALEGVCGPSAPATPVRPPFPEQEGCPI